MSPSSRGSLDQLDQLGQLDQSAQVSADLADATSAAEKISILEQCLARYMTADGPLDWIFALADIDVHNDLPREVLRRTAANLSWQARDIGQRMPAATEWDRCDERPDPRHARRVLAYVHAFRLRFDFKFEELDKECERWLEDFPEDGMIAAFAAFSALGLRSDLGERRLERALNLTDSDSVCRFACLHALWFGTNLKDQAERMMRLSATMIANGEDSHNLYFWRSFALRRLGRLEEAMHSIDHAIALLPVGMNLIHQDYVRERELVKTSQLLNEQLQESAEQIRDQLRSESRASLDEIREDLSDDAEASRKLARSGQVNLVAGIGAFIAVSAFLLGTRVTALGSTTSSQEMTTTGFLVVTVVLFLTALRFAVRNGTRRRASRPD